MRELLECLANYIDPVLRLVEDIAEENLRELDINASGELIDSLQAYYHEYEVILTFADYGVVQDEGVAPESPGGFIARPLYQFAGTDPFQPGPIQTSRETIIRNDREFIVRLSDIRQWVRDRGIQPRSGQDLDGTASAITVAIRQRGYRARPWIDKTLEDPRVESALAAALDRAAQECVDNTLEDFENDIL